MAETPKLHHPWLVAVWPGMGHVALNAGVYLLAKMHMTAVAEFDAGDLFDTDQVEVKHGIVRPPRRPRNRLFVWTDPNHRHDLLVFLGEAQPPVGRQAFCRQLLGYAKQLGVERVFTFAAMATRMRPEHRCRVFAAAADREGLEELKRLELDVLEDGNIGGLNGLLVGAAAEADMPGACLLGEMPHVFAQVPFPKASLAILESFATLARIDLDLSELAEQAKASEEQLGELLTRVEEQYGRQAGEEGEGEGEGADEEAAEEAAEEGGEDRVNYRTEAVEEEPAGDGDIARIEALFEHASRDRSKSFELKRELDRLGLFKQYEDRFLDLFKKKD